MNKLQKISNVKSSTVKKIKNLRTNKDYAIGDILKPKCGFNPPDYVITKIVKRQTDKITYFLALGYHKSAEKRCTVARFLGYSNNVTIIEE